MNVGIVILCFVILAVVTSTVLVFSGTIPMYILDLYGSERLPKLDLIDHFYKTMGYKINEDVPTICFFEPVNEYVRDRFWDETWFSYSVFHLEEWRHKLKATSEGEWNWMYQFYPLEQHIDKGADHYEFKDCNVLIIFAYMSEKRNLGQTAFYYSNSFAGYTIITVWATTMLEGNTTIVLGDTYNDTKLVKQPPKFTEIPPGNIGKIIQHEFGHALGLEHVYKTARSQPIHSIMLPYMEALGTNHNRYVTQTDVDAVVLLYGEDGFGGWNNPQRERFIIIPWLE